MVGYRALSLDANPALLGVLTAMMAVPAFIGALPVGRLADRIGGARVAIFGLILMIIGVGVMILSPNIPMLLVTECSAAPGSSRR